MSPLLTRRSFLSFVLFTPITRPPHVPTTKGGEWQHQPTTTNEHHHVRVSPDQCVPEGEQCPCHSGHIPCKRTDPTTGHTHEWCHYGQFCPVQCPSDKRHCGSHWSPDDPTASPPVRAQQLTQEVCVDHDASCPCHPVNDVQCQGAPRFKFDKNVDAIVQTTSRGWCMSKVDGLRMKKEAEDRGEGDRVTDTGCWDHSSDVDCAGDGLRHCGK